MCPSATPEVVITKKIEKYGGSEIMKKTLAVCALLCLPWTAQAAGLSDLMNSDNLDMLKKVVTSQMNKDKNTGSPFSKLAGMTDGNSLVMTMLQQLAAQKMLSGAAGQTGAGNNSMISGLMDKLMTPQNLKIMQQLAAQMLANSGSYSGLFNLNNSKVMQGLDKQKFNNPNALSQIMGQKDILMALLGQKLADADLFAEEKTRGQRQQIANQYDGNIAGLLQQLQGMNKGSSQYSRMFRQLTGLQQARDSKLQSLDKQKLSLASEYMKPFKADAEKQLAAYIQSMKKL